MHRLQRNPEHFFHNQLLWRNLVPPHWLTYIVYAAQEKRTNSAAIAYTPVYVYLYTIVYDSPRSQRCANWCKCQPVLTYGPIVEIISSVFSLPCSYDYRVITTIKY